MSLIFNLSVTVYRSRVCYAIYRHHDWGNERMKKLVTAIATTAIAFTGVATMYVSAEEHEVVQQDTLWDISQEYGTPVQTLIDINRLDSTIIYPGQQITVNGTANDEVSTDTYNVAAGDTLSEIGATNNVTVDELMELNNLDSTVILIGQELLIGKVGAKENAVDETETVESETDKVDMEVKEDTKDSDETDKVEQSNEQKADASPDSGGETMTVTATAYTAECEGCSGITATGIDLNKDRYKKVIAVDPNVIPLGTEVYVEGYGKAVAGDVGGAIKGDKIDVHVPTKEEANSWGVQTINITILD